MDPLLDTAPCGFVSFADDGRILTANHTLAQLLGHESGELRGRHVETILGLPSRIFFQTHLFPMLRLHGAAEEVYLTLRTATGQDVPVLTNAARSEREGRSDCVFMRIRNRQKFEEELLRAKKAAEAANEAKAAFLSILSHDLRTPLGAISGYVDILEMEIHGPVTDAQREDLRRIRSASEFLLGMIEELLHYSRIDAGQLELRVQHVPLHTVLERTDAILALRVAEAGLVFDSSACDAALRVHADPDRLQQILLNLLTNAIKFTPAGGRVEVACERQGAFVRIVVRDTGRGIPTEHLERIFEPFVQLDPEAMHKGVGLGLAISRRLARAMGGDLIAHSERGAGATFVLTIPAGDAPAPSAPAVPSPPGGSEGAG